MLFTYRPWLAFVVSGLVCWSAMAAEMMPAPAPVPSSPAKIPEGNEAIVNGQAISRKAIFRSLKRVPEDRRAEERVRVINFLIDNLLIDQELIRLKVPADAKAVDARVMEIRAEIKKKKKDFDQVMEDLLLTEDELRAQLRADLRWDRYATEKATAQETRRLFDENPAMFNGSMVHARHILLTPPSKDPDASAQTKDRLALLKKQIEDKVAAGLAKLAPDLDKLKREEARIKLLDQTFAEAAKNESDCPTKAQGGDLGWFPRGKMVEPFAKAAFALKPFQLSDIVTSQVGHHLILVLDTRRGKEVKYEDVKDLVKDVYIERLREDLLAKLRPAAKIVLNPPAKP
jgi:parvulin-like peptidyl-prolyl isomerase